MYVHNDVVVPLMECWRCCHMRGVAGSTPGLDFYLLCEPFVVYFIVHCTSN
jgi:hypothetical protein